VSKSESTHRWRIARHPHAGSGVDAVVIIAAGTILLTRSALHLLGYPRVGSGPLHIAHLLWGGAALTVAALTALSVLGDRPRPITIVLAGIGLELGLDEIGKFVTTTNDYFYKPAVAIMYVLLITVVAISRLVRDLVPRRPHEDLAAAAFIAADGVVRGLYGHRRAQALDYLARASAYEQRQVTEITALLDSCTERPPTRWQRRWSTIGNWHVLRYLDNSIWIRLSALALVTYSAFGLSSATILGTEPIDDVTQFARLLDAAGSGLALVLALPALVWRTDRRWTLEAVRLSSISTLILIQIVEFAQSQFSALADLLVGLVTLSLISRAIAVHARRQSEVVRQTI
jgi:hypothetical protein